MTEQINLKEIEQKAYRSTFQDGLLDIVWGIIILGMGFSPTLKNWGVLKPFNFLLMPLLALLIFGLGKKYITIPRIGTVKFGPKRKQTKKNILIFAAILFPIQVILIILAQNGSFPFNYLKNSSNLITPLFIATFCIIFFALLAYIIDFPRFLLIGVLMSASLVSAEILYPSLGTPLDGLIPFSISGLIVLLIGLVVLTRFLQKYPKVTEELNHA
jgi:hypothetical protein